MRGDTARKRALREGRATYVGSPCIHGHSGLRWTSTCGCVACKDADRQANLAHRALYQRHWRATNREKAREQSRRSTRNYTIRHPERAEAAQLHHRALVFNAVALVSGVLGQVGWEAHARNLNDE